MPDKPDRRGEFALIRELFQPLADAEHGLSLKDDVGFLPPVPSGMDACITKDMIVEGVHFLPDDPPETIARKLVRVNVSDLVCKGAVPASCLLAGAFGPGADDGWLEAFAAGLKDDLATFGLALLGGDTVGTPGPTTLSLTAIGHVAAGQLVRRSGAREGDGVYVTGTIGDAALGLKILQGEFGEVALGPRTPLVARYREPEPRAAFGRYLPGFASAALDVSDGLIADLAHICEESGLAADIDFARVPFSSSAQRHLKKDRALKLAVLGGGDDYEILFTAPPSAAASIAEASGETETAVTRIGQVAGGEAGAVRVLDEDGSPLDIGMRGFSHG